MVSGGWPKVCDDGMVARGNLDVSMMDGIPAFIRDLLRFDVCGIPKQHLHGWVGAVSCVFDGFLCLDLDFQCTFS